MIRMLQDGLADDSQSTDVVSHSSTMHHNNAVNETSSPTNHNQSSDHNQYVASIACC